MIIDNICIILEFGDIVSEAMSERRDDKLVEGKSSKTLFLVKAALIGGLRGAFGMPFEHPFDTLKTWMQAENSTIRESFKSIVSKKGYLGFYSGFVVNTLRVMSRQIYRWPLTLTLLSFFRKWLNVDDRSTTAAMSGYIGLLTGLSIALIESIVVCPL